jgi:hypothetical protein
MSDKKMQARREMVRKLAKEKVSQGLDGIGDALKGKKISKVEVIAKDGHGLEEGLSTAQKILKARLGKESADEPEEDDSEEGSDVEEAMESAAEEAAEGDEGEEAEKEAEGKADCKVCHGAGCPICSSEVKNKLAKAHSY